MEPKDFARLLLRRKSTVILATLIVMGTVVSMSLRAAPQYVAQCEVLFQGIGYELSEGDSRGVEPFGDIGTNLDIVTSPEVIDGALATLQEQAPAYNWTLGDVAGKTNVTIKNQDTQILLLQVADLPPKSMASDLAAARSGLICNAQAQAYVDYRRKKATELYHAELANLRTQLENLQPDLDRARYEFEASYGENQYSPLTFEKQNSFNELVAMKGDLVGRFTAISGKIRRGVNDEGGELYRKAGPGAKIGGDLKRTGMLGFIVGLMFGIGIALIREYMDDTVKDKESAARELGLPVLANLPATSDLDGFEGPPQATIEAARTLRATLASYGFPAEKRMLLVASSLSKRRSTTLAALAGAVAESGRSVLVIGSDLRSSRTHEAFGIANTLGLANVVRGQVPFRNAIRPAPGLENVYVLPCGPVIGSPGEILSSEAMAFVLREAREWADVVLLDAPPILAAADASILGAYADGVVMVVSAGRTSRAKAAEAKEQLAAAGARVLGAVLIGGDDERDRDAIDDLDGFMPTGGGFGSFEPAYAGVGASGGDWYGDDVITATARTVPAPRRSSERPAKKVSAAGRDTRPRHLSEPSVPASARTAVRRAPSGMTERSAPAARAARPARPTPKKRPTTKRVSSAARTTSRTGSASTARRAAIKPAAKKTTTTKTTAARKPTAAHRPTAARKPTAKRAAPRSSAARSSTSRTAPRRTATAKRSAPSRSTSKTRR